jgi:hypothetical protein
MIEHTFDMARAVPHCSGSLVYRVGSGVDQVV